MTLPIIILLIVALPWILMVGAIIFLFFKFFKYIVQFFAYGILFFLIILFVVSYVNGS